MKKNKAAKPIFLIGFMASGKTTLGSPLAKALGRRFVDLDEAIEAAAGKSTSAIFADEGEARFRQLESEALRTAATGDTVVACGGGTPCHAGNMDFMLGAGFVVCLEASPAVTVRRLRLAPGKRPLVDALLGNPAALSEKVAQMLDARRSFYSRAHSRFCSDRLESKEEIDGSVDEFIRLFKSMF